jgi:hypothetical protein
MKPLAKLQQSKGTPFEKMDRLFKTVVAAPKAAVDREEAKQKRRKEKAKKPT